MKFHVEITITNRDGKVLTESAEIEFYNHPNDYGNGYGMAVESKLEPFGEQGYDIRYDKDFNKNYPIEYIASFYDRRYNAKDGAWKLLAISIRKTDE